MVETCSEYKSESFKDWLVNKPVWEQLLWFFHDRDKNISEEVLDLAFEHMLFENGLVTQQPETPKDFYSPSLEIKKEDDNTKCELKEVTSFINVNAINENSVLPISPNLTLVYGDNGVGKSGFGRLFSNACTSRKQRKLIENLNEKITGEISAEFLFHDDGSDTNIKFSIGEQYSQLKRISVFDGESALVHLNNNNEVYFNPAKLQIFDLVSDSVNKLEIKLQDKKLMRYVKNPIEDSLLRTEESEVSILFRSLSREADLSQLLLKLDEFSEDYQKELDDKYQEIHSLKSENPEEKKKIFENVCSEFNKIAKIINDISLRLSYDAIQQLNTLFEEYHDAKKVLKEISLEDFKLDNLSGIGSDEWKSLIEAALQIYEAELEKNHNFEIKNCVLCHQSLTPKEQNLFSKYRDFLENKAEKKVADIELKLKEVVEELMALKNNLPKLDGTYIPTIYLKNFSPDMFTQLMKLLHDIEDNVGHLVQSVNDRKKISESELSLLQGVELETVVEHYEVMITKLEDLTPAIDKLEKEITLLNHKQFLNEKKDDIRKYIEYIQWLCKADSINISSRKAENTRMKSQIVDSLILSNYVEIFNDEMKNLGCDFGIEIDSKGRDLTPMKRLRLSLSKDFKPGDILSEGEQTLTAFVDFLAEVKMSENNIGIVFDDPVSSLDHKYRTLIAKRLAEESKSRQVIIFTHDIVFLLELISNAEFNSIDYKKLCLRKSGNSSGIVKEELPWIACGLKEKIGHLKNELQNMKKELIESPEDCLYKVKTWYLLLRESWERAVEERLLKQVVQRFDNAIQTQRLKRISIDENLIKKIEDGMSTSKWVHDSGAANNIPVPDFEKLSEDLLKLDDFSKLCKAD